MFAERPEREKIMKQKLDSALSQFASNFAAFRKYSGKSLKEVAERLEVAKQTVNKYEKGLLDPSMKRIEQLAEIFDISVGDFFNPIDKQKFCSRLFDLKAADFDEHIEFQFVRFREGEKSENELIDRVKDQALQKFLAYEELLELSNYNQKFKNPVKDLLIKTRKDAQKAAMKVRKAWKLGVSPIQNVISMLEDQGIRVIEVQEELQFEGLSAMIDEVPIIVINGSIEEVTRRRFTALHELSHLILCVEGLNDTDIEKICDAFAGTMLMPEELLIIEIGEKRSKISKMELLRVKERNGISILALLYCAADYGVISWDLYNEIKFEQKFESDSTVYWINETPMKFRQLLMRARMESLISRKKASELSGISTSKLEQIEETYI